MLQRKKNQIVLGALVMMVMVAGYLNYIDTTTEADYANSVMLSDEGDVLALIVEKDDTTGETFADVTPDNPEISTVDSTENNEDVNTESKAGEAIFVSSNTDAPYFVTAKLEREQARAKQKDFLVEMINNESLAQDAKKDAANKMLTIQDRIEKETAAEAMIQSKGFDSVYVRIDDTTVDVVVDKPELTEAEVAQIEDIVKRKTGMEASQIRISTLKS